VFDEVKAVNKLLGDNNGLIKETNDAKISYKKENKSLEILKIILLHYSNSNPSEEKIFRIKKDVINYIKEFFKENLLS
jgi:aspartyl/asparaginyl-tRNA synthetase